MLAYHNNQAVKDRYVLRMRAHRAADELVAGVGWEPGNGQKPRGCAVGCTFDAYDHTRGPVEIGVPAELMRVEDSIFEGLARFGDDNEHLAFPESFLTAIPVGADLSLVWPRFALWLLDGLDSPIPVKVRNHRAVKSAIDGVSAVMDTPIWSSR